MYVFLNLFQSRFEKIIEVMADKKIDAIWLFPSANMYYLTGFWPSAQDRAILSILSKTGESIFIIPEIYERQISRQTWIKDIRVWRKKIDFETLLNEAVRELSLSNAKIAVEDRTWAESKKKFRELSSL